MLHVTANEAGRNAVMQDKLITSIELLMQAIKSKTVKPREIYQCLRIIKRYLLTNLKTRPTV